MGSQPHWLKVDREALIVIRVLTSGAGNEDWPRSFSDLVGGCDSIAGSVGDCVPWHDSEYDPLSATQCEKRYFE